jgi:hypothetical protein
MTQFIATLLLAFVLPTSPRNQFITLYLDGEPKESLKNSYGSQPPSLLSSA